MDYNARWYSPSLGRFTQPDTIIPDLANPQALNRYSYTYNNPVNYSDPTGHRREKTNDRDDIEEKLKKRLTNYYGVEIQGNWHLWQIKIANRAVKKADKALHTVGSSFTEAFNTKPNGGENIIFNKWNYEGVGASHTHQSGKQIDFYGDVSEGLIVHELGHAFDFSRGGGPASDYGSYVVKNHYGVYRRPFGFKQDNYGIYGDGFNKYWFSFPLEDSHPRHEKDYENNGEIFADLFVAWVFNYWPDDNPKPD